MPLKVKRALEEPQSEYISSPFGFFCENWRTTLKLPFAIKTEWLCELITYDTEVKPDIYDMAWDGRDNNGNLVTDTTGKYYFDVKAVSSGAEIEVTKLGVYPC